MRTLELCEDGHSPIAFACKSCPVCEVLAGHANIVETLEDTQKSYELQSETNDALHREIQELETRIATAVEEAKEEIYARVH